MQEVLIAVAVALVLVIIVAIIVIVYASTPPPTQSTQSPNNLSLPQPQPQFQPMLKTPLQYQVQHQPETVPVNEPTPVVPQLTFIPTDAFCHNDSECPGSFVCTRSKLLNQGRPYENAIFDKYGYSLTDVAVLNNKLYFILDEDKLGVVEPGKETYIYGISVPNLIEIVAFNHKLYLRTREGKILLFDGQDLVPLKLNLPRVSYMSATPDNQYLYLNDTLYDTKFKVVQKFTWGKRVFWTPDTYLMLEPKLQLTQNNQVVMKEGLPTSIRDAAFNSEGELFLVEGNEQYSHVRVVAGTPFLFTQRVCEKKDE